jgi:hypothetical protein
MHGNKKLRNPTDNFNDVIEYQNHLARRNNGVNVPIYITEMGVPTYDGEGGVTRLNAAIFAFKYTLLAMSDKNIKEFGGMITPTTEFKERIKRIILDSSIIIIIRNLQLLLCMN